MRKVKAAAGTSMHPLKTDDAIRAFMQVDPKRVKAAEKAEKAATKKPRRKK